MTRLSIGLLWMILMVAGGSTIASAPAIGEAAMPSQWEHEDRQPQWRSGSVELADVSHIRFQPLPDERIVALKRHNGEPGIKPLQIGIGRDLASEADPYSTVQPELSWHAVTGGLIARLEVTSPRASGLRVGLRLANLAAGSELRVAGSDQPDVIHLAGSHELEQLVDTGGLYWTAVTDGEGQSIELFVPHGTGLVEPPVIRVESSSHLLVALNSSADIAKALGDSGSCQIDVVCRFNALGQRFVNAKNSVARYVVQNGASTYSCSGTLLNDADPSGFTPWFITAQHCVGSQSHANTVRTFWNFETPACNVDNAGPNIQIGGGAALMHADARRDATLLRLNRAPPSGAIFAGWDANPLAAGSAITAIHHPAGDIKKVSRGTHSGVTANVTIGGNARIDMLRATWNEGSTEGGSSGSGLFTLGQNNYQLRGTLSGGSASCSNASQPETGGNRDYYSRFSDVYPSIRQFIYAAAPANGPTRDYSGAWYLPAEPGRGLSLYQYPDDTLFGLWFIYDSAGRASWYQLDPTWTGIDVAEGRVVRWAGPAWGPTYSGTRNYVVVGTFTLRFTTATNATLGYQVDGVSRTIAISRL
jgi:lysyl endopeptidase